MNLSDLVPSGAHTYSRSMDCFPANAPEYLVRANGCYVWDNNSKKYIEWGMSLRSVILGYCNKKVDNAVKNAINKGISFTRPSMYEMELAEMMRDLIPCCEMVKFGKNGSDATSAAVRLARAYTKRDIVLIAEENPFISTADFFIETTALNDGCFISGKTLQYSYNNMDFDKFDLDKVACIILDSSTVDVTKEKLQCIRDICDKYNIVMILDEVISGFRYDLRGVQGLYGVTPDLATFGKAMANGYSISALCGKKDIMRLGDRKYGNVFLLSGTYFGETTGYAAALATIKELQTVNVHKKIIDVGYALYKKLEKIIGTYCMDKDIKFLPASRYCSPLLAFSSMELKTLFDQKMTAQGIIMPYIAPSFSHGDNDIDKTIEAAEWALTICRNALDNNRVKESLINGHCEKPVFRRK